MWGRNDGLANLISPKIQSSPTRKSASFCNLIYPTPVVYEVNLEGVMISRPRMLEGTWCFVGEMERDAVISHGAVEFLRDRLCFSSDRYETAFCKSCGTVAKHEPGGVIECIKCKGKTEPVRCVIPRVYIHIDHILRAMGVNIKHNLIPATQS